MLVKGNGFLYNMIRIIAGTLIDVSEKRIAPDDIPAILAAKDRLRAGRTAMAHGLYLNRVFYSEEELLRET
jgi:tRNA pseudouridine38-40 synthase